MKDYPVFKKNLNKAQRPMMRPHEFWGISFYKRCEDAMENLSEISVHFSIIEYGDEDSLEKRGGSLIC